MHPCYFWAIWLKETYISDIYKKKKKQVKFDPRTTQGLFGAEVSITGGSEDLHKAVQLLRDFTRCAFKNKRLQV